MGSKLSLFRRTVEIEVTQSENLNNKVSSSEPQPTQPSEPTPITKETVKVEPKCGCVDCKCDPCNCHKKDTPTEVEVKVETTQQPSEDKPLNQTESNQKTEEPDITTVHIESLQINEESTPSPVIIEEIVSAQEKPSEESTQDTPKEEPQTEEPTKDETPAPECCQPAEEVPKDEPQEEKKCLCDPCQCNPCKCCGQDSEIIQNEPQSQENEEPESQRGNAEQLVSEVSEKQNPAEEMKDEESVAEARDPIENVETVPQETNQPLDVQTTHE